ncbi:MAG: malate dehydrogenase [Candidatus Saganbacteria bacterium]|uniref:Malate dehydrogenase n=1 Tax=Candidatus Saganbacteria bacterium TaxID=2575572 RepID=A0A833L1X6_UNCSA|nr:MAG: malate dehydrogenase [Candidatus Saganbacteria bacterium]
MKITVVGAGNVGAQCAYRLAQKQAGEVVLIDVVAGLPQGKALDMMQAGFIEGFSTKIKGTNDYKDTKDSNVVVITAGLARKPGMSRDDLISKNAEIIASIVKNIVQYSPKAILIIVTNPLDVMTYFAYKLSGFDHRRVFGMAPLLDAARMQYFIAEACGDANNIYAEVLGSHGDLMVPVPRFSTVKGKPITEILNPEQVNNIEQKTKNGGAEIVGLLKTGSAYYAPGSAAAHMAEAVAKDKKEVIGTCCYLTGEYGLSDVYIGVPAKIGRGGVEEVIELDLLAPEKKALHDSANAVKEICEKLTLPK